MGGAQGLKFSKAFIDKCSQAFVNEFQVNIDDFASLDNPYNFTKNTKHEVYTESAQFRRRLYFEVAKEIFEDLPQKKQIHTLLFEYYLQIIQSGDINQLDFSEQIMLLDEFRQLSSQLNQQDSRLYQFTNQKLIDICLQEGLFEKCLQIGMDLLDQQQQLPLRELQQICENLIEAAFGAGDTRLEEYLIELYSTKIITKHKTQSPRAFLYQSKYDLRCSDAEAAVRSAKAAISAVDENTSDHLVFKCYEQLITAYFYAGDHQEGFQLLTQIEKQFADFLQQHRHLRASLNHNYGLLCHNIELNAQIVNRAQQCCEDYQRLHDKYNYLISCVNLADGYMGMGNLVAAEKEISAVYQYAKSTHWKHATNIAATCYGNILFQQGKYAEALHRYEEGIHLSKQINHNWDRLYGQIWRALCLAYFGDPIAYHLLTDLRAECQKRNYTFLYALSTCYLILTKSKLDLKQGNYAALLTELDQVATPGLYAQSLATIILQFTGKEETRTKMVHKLITCVLRCEGIRGLPEIIGQAIHQSNPEALNQQLLGDFLLWEKSYIKPMQYFKENLYQQLADQFQSDPKIKQCGGNCEAICCYDGVYLLDGEEEKIKQAVKTNPDFFTQLPEQYIVDGNWHDIVKGRKTATRTHQYQDPHFPKHFEQTRCVFADDQGYCKLQILATQTDCHPWKYKPKACWVFPITLEQGKICAPPSEHEQDPDAISGDYPGFVKYVPCGQHHDQGEKWYQVYQQEILNLKFTDDKE